MRIIIRDSKSVPKTILVEESIPVSQLKDQIKSTINITGEIELLFNGIILNDNDYLCDLDIKEGSTLDYLGRFDAGLNKIE